MENLVKKLAYARQVETEYKAKLAELDAEIEAKYGQARKRATELLNIARHDVADADAKLRQAAVTQFAETGEKKVHEAVTVKIFRVLQYLDAEALFYCREHLPQALRYDKKVFEKAAEAIDLDFVTTTEEPRATIARDLSAYLEKQV